MSELDDRELRDRLGRDSGPFPDANTAYAAVLTRVGRARRRRAAAVAGATAAVVVAAVGIGIGVGDRGRPHTLSPAATSSLPAVPLPGRGTTTTTSSTTTTTTTTTTTVPPTTAATTTVAGTVDPNAAQVPSPTVVGHTATTGQPRPPAAGTAAPRPPAPGTTTPAIEPPAVPPSTPTVAPPPPIMPPTSDPPPVVPPTTGPPSVVPTTGPPSGGPPTTTPVLTQTFTGQGGSVTVELRRGTLRVIRRSPAPDYRPSSRSLRGDHVEISFTSPGHVTDIRVDLVGQVMVASVSEHDPATVTTD